MKKEKTRKESREQWETDCFHLQYGTEGCKMCETCEYRHQAEAINNKEVCSYWLAGKCTMPGCPYKHLELEKNRLMEHCFHENRKGGCQKPYCAFFHDVPAITKKKKELESG